MSTACPSGGRYPHRFAVSIAWPLSAVTLSRLIFHLRGVEKDQPLHTLEELEPPVPQVPSNDGNHGPMIPMQSLACGHVQSQSGDSTATNSGP